MENIATYTLVDLLCGLGGGTEGAQKSDNIEVIQGLNHSESAIRINKANHASVDFKIIDLYAAQRKEIMPCDIVLAGIECTNHSGAKGGSSRKADSRAMANEMMRYSEMTGCKIMIFENVVEFRDWGPIIPKRDKNGVILKIKKGKDKGKPIMIPDPKRKKQSFNKWKYKMQKDCGFVNYSERLLCAADFGIATTRKRLFMIFAKEGYNIEWPEVTHSKTPDLRGLKPWVPCKKFIDLNNHGKSIFGRKRKDGSPNPLVPNTLARIAYGIKKYKGAFIMKYYGTGNNVTDLQDPLHTITTKDRHALITTDQFYLQHYHGSHSAGDIESPLKTIVTKDEKAFITVEKLQFIDKYLTGKTNVSGIEEPIHTITTNPAFSLTTIDLVLAEFNRVSAIRSVDEPIATLTTFQGKRHIKVEMLQFISKHFGGNHATSLDDPLATITTKDHNTLTSCYIGDGMYLLDIKMRWLTPRELASCQGFPEDYILLGTKAEQIKGIGNSIPPGMITAICNSMTNANK